MHRPGPVRRLVVAAIALGLFGLSCRAADGNAPGTPTEPAHHSVAMVERIDMQRLASSDLRLRLLYARWPGSDIPLATGSAAREPLADLVEEALGSTDPVVLELLLQRCSRAPSDRPACDPVALARRWVAVDQQNQLAWLALAQALRTTGYEDESIATLERAALAPAWHEHVVDVGRLLHASEERTDDVDDRAAMLVSDLGRVSGGLLVGTGNPTLVRFCSLAGHRSACARIVDTMMRDSDSLVTLRIAFRLAVRAGIDPQVAAGYQMKADAIAGAMYADPLEGDFDAMDGTARRAAVIEWAALLDLGEVRFWQNRMIRHRLDERTVAAQYVATLAPGELQRRARPPAPLH